jgi:hypothetical protein
MMLLPEFKAFTLLSSVSKPQNADPKSPPLYFLFPVAHRPILLLSVILPEMVSLSSVGQNVKEIEPLLDPYFCIDDSSYTVYYLSRDIILSPASEA